MITLDRIIAVIIIIWVFIYTVSYGRWTWQKKNWLGAVMIFLLALTSLVLPVYSIFYKQG